MASNFNKHTADACPFCRARTRHKEVRAREMMYGLREPFTYRECATCGSLWIAEVPTDLHRFYEGYYSFADHRDVGLRAGLRAVRDRLALGFYGWIGQRLAARLRPSATIEAIGILGLRPNARIIDVGCGSGWLLDELHAAGFTDLSGADPFVEAGARTHCGIPIHATSLEGIAGPFDLIMFHHSLEHMADPCAVLTEVAAKLALGGRCLVRVPTTTSDAYAIYGADWVGLDPPRHLAIPSRQGIVRAAEIAGLAIGSVRDDSTALQFVGSERYRRDIALNEPDSGREPDRKTARALRRRVADVNRRGRGDAISVTMTVRATRA